MKIAIKIILQITSQTKIQIEKSSNIVPILSLQPNIKVPLTHQS